MGFNYGYEKKKFDKTKEKKKEDYGDGKVRRKPMKTECQDN